MHPTRTVSGDHLLAETSFHLQSGSSSVEVIEAMSVHRVLLSGYEARVTSVEATSFDTV